MTVTDGVQSPASKKMDEAIEWAIEGKPIVPERSSFVDAGTPYTERELRLAAEIGNSAVLVFPDGSMQILPPEQILEREELDSA
ncbi:MAG TPA: hypothetical protein VH703_02895 [Solirubrobacterales bacterium]|jgi:hypothetical protein